MNKAPIGICIVGVVALSACSRDPRNTRIVSRTISPDGTREAVYSEDISGGATVGPSEEIYVVAKGSTPRLQDRVFRQERVCHLKMRWLNNEAIEIGYSARTALLAERNERGPVEVRTKWLGSDAANGC